MQQVLDDIDVVLKDFSSSSPFTNKVHCIMFACIAFYYVLKIFLFVYFYISALQDHHSHLQQAELRLHVAKTALTLFKVLLQSKGIDPDDHDIKKEEVLYVEMIK